MSTKKLTLKPKTLRKLLAKVRIKILAILYNKDTCACEIVKEVNLKNNLISHHLKVLSDMSFVKNKRNGRHMIYSLNPSKRETVKKILDLIEI
jgi:ArsR family transcriptional regulator